MTNAPKILDGRDPAAFVQQRHAQIVAGLAVKPRLAIIRSQDNEAADRYLKVKSSYGQEIGVGVDIFVEDSETILGRIKVLGDDPAITGIIVQLPLPSPELTAKALAAVPVSKDIDGLAPHTAFETATPKGVMWLLASYNIDVGGRIVIVGQGRLVGKPLAARLEASGHEVVRCDIATPDLGAVTRTADMLFTGTGRAGLITSDMVKEGAVIIDTGAPRGELDSALYERRDLTITPNPGGVGPMTVAALFDNLLIAAQAS